jgi:hypothetical protein
MSLNFDVNSNLSHTMEKLQKCVNFILTVLVFFATNCTTLTLLSVGLSNEETK